MPLPLRRRKRNGATQEAADAAAEAPAAQAPPASAAAQELGARLGALAAGVQALGKRVEALARQQDLVALHKSLHPAIVDTRKIVGELEQSAGRIEGFLNIDLPRLVQRDSAEVASDAAAPESRAHERRVERIEWMMGGALCLVLLQTVAMIAWLLK
jgi:hypothetical protein